MKKSNKQFRLGILDGWMTKLESSAHGKYVLAKLAADGISPREVSKNMTACQIRVLISLISAAYSTGCSDTRTHIHSLRAAS